MTGFSYENKDGAYKLTIGKGYTGEDPSLQAFAENYWNGPNPLTLYLADGIEPDMKDDCYKHIVYGLRGWLVMKGLERFIKQTATENRQAKDGNAPPNPRWDRDIESIHTLVHIVAYQAVEGAIIKIV